MRIVLYITAIVVANIITSAIPPLSMFGFLVPAGTFLIGFTFVMRDFVQIHHGRKKTYIVIISALLISALVAFFMGNGIRIVLASALSFALSEFADTEIFTRMKSKLSNRILASGLVGSAIDSVIFTVAAGFPFQAAIGQLIVKSIMQALGAVAITKKTFERIDTHERT